MPRGTRWLLGGGNKKRGLATVREAAAAEAPFFARAEARFALWDMQVRERLIGEAVVTARDLTRDFPDNAELQRFVNTYSDAPVAASRQRLAPNAPAGAGPVKRRRICRGAERLSAAVGGPRRHSTPPREKRAAGTPALAVRAPASAVRKTVAARS